jgi:hypothetical protein
VVAEGWRRKCKPLQNGCMLVHLWICLHACFAPGEVDDAAWHTRPHCWRSCSACSGIMCLLLLLQMHKVLGVWQRKRIIGETLLRPAVAKVTACMEAATTGPTVANAPPPPLGEAALFRLSRTLKLRARLLVRYINPNKVTEKECVHGSRRTRK